MPLSKEVLLDTGPRLREELRRRRPQEDAQFLWESLLKEQATHKAEPPMTEAEVTRRFGTARWAPVPSFCHTQPCGKQRRIDDAKKGRQNQAIAYTEKGHLCTAFQPATCARLVVQEAGQGSERLRALGGLRSGCDDMPNAFRSIPAAPQDLDVNVVAVQHPDSGQWMFQIVWATLFGLSSSVMHFARWSHFLQAIARRIIQLMWSMYVDDGSLVDAEAAGESGQQAAASMFQDMGTPLAVEKRKKMSVRNDFLGIQHDLGQALASGTVAFWVRQALHDKVHGMLRTHIEQDSLTPAESSKLVGSMGFAMQAAFGKVGQAAFAPLSQRMHTDNPPWSLSLNIRWSFEFLEVLLQEKPRRVVQLFKCEALPLVIASDAQAEMESPSGGYLALDARSGTRSGGWCKITEQHLHAWGFTKQGLVEGQNPIQCCEAAMLPWTILHLGPKVLRGRRVLWFVDNTSALYAAIKGSSKHPAVARAIAFASFAQFHWDFQVWFEFVDSKGNWSDSISRELGADDFAARHAFSTSQLEPTGQLWLGSLKDLWSAVREQRWTREAVF